MSNVVSLAQLSAKISIENENVFTHSGLYFLIQILRLVFRDYEYWPKELQYLQGNIQG